MIRLLHPLTSGRDTEIDMIEREMEGGVLVIQPADLHEHSVDSRVGGLIRVDEDVKVYEIRTKAEVPKD